MRRWLFDPARLVAPYVKEGMVVLEPGPGMGFFTIELAKRVGASGRVVVVDIQPRMIEGLKRRAAKAGLLERIDARMVQPSAMGLDGLNSVVDFVLAFAVVHELPEPAIFFVEAADTMKPNANLLLAEPTGHVSVEQFEDELRMAAAAGLTTADRPSIRRSHSALLKKT
jgi:SAM-dependent methyltransferase